MFENEKTWAKYVANNSTDEFHKKFDQAIEQESKDFGKNYPMIIAGKEVFSNNQFQVKSPADKKLTLANFPLASNEDTLHAIESAKNLFYGGRLPHINGGLGSFMRLQISFHKINSILRQ